MSTTKELLEQRASLILQAQQLIDGKTEGRALTSEDEAKFDKLAIVLTKVVAGRGTVWTYVTECAEGGDHTTEETTA